MDETVARIAEHIQRKRYGKYRGFVVDNDDPEHLGRVRVTVPSVLGETVSGWALPCLPFGGLGDQGMFMVPEIDSAVWVEFEEGNLDRPIWVGVYWRSGDVPSEAAVSPPTTRVIKTPSGHVLAFDDAQGGEQIRLQHPSDAEVVVDENGSIALTDASGARLNLDASSNTVIVEDSNGNRLTMDASGTVVTDVNGNSVEMAAAGITVKGQTISIEGTQIAIGGAGGEPLIKGMSFLTLFATHMHTCTAPGAPSSPPIPQGEMSTLTTKSTAS